MVILKGCYTVKPAEPTPNNRLPLSEFDQAKPFILSPTVYFYRPIGNSVASAIDTLRDSLSRVLVHFYPLAGRLYSIDGGRFELQCNAMGALLFEAESESKMDDLGDFRPTPEIGELVPHVDHRTPVHEIPLLVVQLTRFRCGGVCIGMGISYIIADGQSALHFVGEWARIARGEKLDTAPFLDREVFLDQNPPAAPRFDHEEYSTPPSLIGGTDEKEQREMETTVAMLKLSKDQVEKLKKKANEGHNGRPYSRYEAVAGHIWRCACKARRHESDQMTKIRVTVDCRNRLQPPLPKGYFGNASLPTTPTSRAGELLSKPLGYASSRIREAVEKMTDEYIRSAIDFLRCHPDLSKFKTFHSLRCPQGAFFGNPNLDITSWMGLPIYGADFGWGKEFHMGPAKFLGVDGKSFILQSPHADGSFIVPLCLQVDFMEAFNELLYQDI